VDVPVDLQVDLHVHLLDLRWLNFEEARRLDSGSVGSTQARSARLRLARLDHCPDRS